MSEIEGTKLTSNRPRLKGGERARPPRRGVVPTEQERMSNLLPTLEVCDVPKGAGTAPVVFMLAGFPDDHSVFAKLADDLKRTHRVIVACLPLYDQTSLKEGQSDYYSVEEVLFRLEATVYSKTDPGQKVTLVIHDFGCPFGYHFAFLHPDKVDRLVGLDIGCTNLARPAEKGSRHRYKLEKFPELPEGPEPPRTKDKLNQLFYQLYFSFAYLFGRKVNYAVGTALLRGFIKCMHLFRFLNTDPKSKAARDLKDVRCWHAYPYWAMWSKILFRPKSYMYTHTYESQYTSSQGKAEGKQMRRAHGHTDVHSLFLFLSLTKVASGYTGLIPVWMPMPKCDTLFLYGKRKRIMFHNNCFLKYLKDTPGCAAMGVDGGHWMFLDKPDFCAKVIRDFMDGIVYNYADTIPPKM